MTFLLFYEQCVYVSLPYTWQPGVYSKWLMNKFRVRNFSYYLTLWEG